MKFLFAQPAIERFAWELKTAISQLNSLGVQDRDVVLLFTDDDASVYNSFADCDVHVYKDERDDKSYIPSIRPYLWHKFLSESIDCEQETYVYLDSDTLVLDLSAFDVPVNENNWFASDTNGYINRDYILSTQNGEHVLEVMENTVGVSDEWVRSINDNSGGAQWVIENPSAAYWLDVYNASNDLYHAIQPLETDLQKWTAEMWAQLWVMSKYHIQPHVSEQLNFAWSTDEQVGENKIIHNAGVTDDMDLFFKGKHVHTPSASDLRQDAGKVSDIYVKAVRNALYGV